MKVSGNLIRRIVHEIVQAVAPDKVILFGSAAGGKAGPDSDLDFLVVADCPHRRQAARIIRRKLIGIPVQIDIIVATPEDIRRHKDSIGLIFRPALRQGKVVYAV